MTFLIGVYARRPASFMQGFLLGWQKPHQGRKVLIWSVKATSLWGHAEAVELGAFVSAIVGPGQVGFGLGKTSPPATDPLARRKCLKSGL